MDRAKIAKSNLKKSVIFGGSIGLITLGGGLGIAIPTYYRIQKELSKSIKSAADLSMYMSQLASKLGVSPDTELTQELQGGYELVFQNGETKIFKREGDSRALVMNMNKDGSVGSAAQMTGPAALGMIQIVSSAASTLSQSAESMEAVLGPFAEQAEDTSLKIESAVTGKTPAELLARNALANPDAADAEKALEALKASNPDVAALPQDKLDSVKQDVSSQQQQMKQAETMTAEQLQAQRDKELAEYKAKLDEINARLKAAYKEGIVGFYNAYKGKTSMKDLDLSQTEKDLLDFVLAKADEATVAAWIDDASTTVDQVKETFSSAKNAMVVIEAMAAARAKQAQAELEAAKNNDDIITRIASKLDSFLNAYVRTFGYNNVNDKNDAKPFEANTALRNSLVSKVKSLGMTQEAVERLDKEIKKLLGQGESTEDEGRESSVPTSKLTFSVEVNTFNEANPDYSRLVVLRAIKTHYEPSEKFETKSEYCIALSGERNFLDLNSIKFVNDETYGKNLENIESSINFIVQLIKSDAMLDLKNKGIKILKDEATQSILKGVSNPVYFDQLINIAKKIGSLQIAQNNLGVHSDADSQNVILRQYLTQWILKLADEYLFSGKDVSFQAESVIALAEKVLKLDNATLPHSASSIYQLDAIDSSYGEWMNKLKLIFEAPNEKQIDNRVNEYRIFSEGVDTLNSYDQDKIKQLENSNKNLYDELLSGKDANGVYGNDLNLYKLFASEHFHNVFASKNGLNYDWTKLTYFNSATDINKVISNFAKLDALLSQEKTKVITESQIQSNWQALKTNIASSDDQNMTNSFDAILALSNYDQNVIDSLKAKDANAYNSIASGAHNELTSLMTSDDWNALFKNQNGINFDWSKLMDLSGFTDKAKMIQHIKQVNMLLASTTSSESNGMKNLINSDNWKVVKGALLRTDMDDISFMLKDMFRYVSSGTGFDISNPANQDKIAAASGVSAALAGNNISGDQAEAIQQGMTNVMIQSQLTPDEFKVVVEYTNTVFVVLSKDEAAKKLVEVLNPSTLNSDKVNKIAIFNQWVKEVKNELHKDSISRQDIEKYVWTKDIHSEVVHKEGAAINDGIVSATLIAGATTSDDKTIIVRHGSEESRPVWEVVTDGTTTTLTQVATLGGSPDYISSQVTDGHVIYFMALDNPDKLYVYDVTTKQLSNVALSQAITTNGISGGKVRSIAYNDGFIYAAVAAGETIYKVNVTSGAVTQLGSLTSGLINDWGMSVISTGSSSLEIYGVKQTSDNHLGVVVRTNGVLSDFIDLDSMLKAKQITGIITAEYDAKNHTQTFFVIGKGADVIKVTVSLVGNKPMVISSETFSLITSDDSRVGTIQQVRGATFAHGAITIFAADKAVYIADQTSNLQDIFDYLL